MNQFIEKLAHDFDIEIVESNIPLKRKNTYRTDSEGNIIMLNLRGIKLEKLSRLLPIAEHLKILSLYNCAIKKIGKLKEFTQLEELNLRMNPVSKLKGIKKLTNLKKLIISFTKIKSIEQVQYLSHLKVLDVYSTRLPSITGIEHLKYLEELIVPDIESFDLICAIKSLKKISLRNNEITEIKGLEKFPNLEELDLFANGISEIKGLEMLKNLRILDLCSTRVTEIKGLENLGNLENLSLGHTSIPKIKGLENLVNLKELDLTNYLGESLTPLTEIQGLEHLSKLEKLILTGHRIKELKNLPNKNLRTLEVSSNKIEYIDYDWLKTIKQPCTISLTGNPVEIIEEEIPDYITIITIQND